MSDTVIHIENLSKRYIIGHQQTARRYLTLRDSLAGVANNLARRLFKGKSATENDGTHEEFWALKDVSFEVKRGECVGIIGRNGAGKSTLLKILSRITEPTQGRIRMKGRVASLLEVGTGFHPELTGRENIYLNGAILGMKRDEIKRKFDEIVSFAEVEKFLDTPVKHYSSGMYMRLAFAVAAHLEPEILVVDEVLAVGDAGFQKKCLGKMDEVARGGRTVLFVSHNMDAVRNLCSHSLLLRQGTMVFHGDTSSTIENYMESGSSQLGDNWCRKAISNGKSVQITRIACSLNKNLSEDHLLCEMEVETSRTASQSFVAVDILARNFVPIMQAIPSIKPFISGTMGIKIIKFVIVLPPLVPGPYMASFWIGSHFSETYDFVPQAVTFEITTSPCPDRTFPHNPDHGFIVPNCRLID